MRLACWLLALFALPLGAQQIPAAARRADLSYVATQVPQLDPNFYSQLDPAAYQQAVAALQSQISTLPDAQFYVQLAALIALAGDAHTNIALNGSAAAVAGFLQFPLQFQWLDDGVFVTSAAATYEQALGARLVQVGGVSIDQVVQELGAIIPHANDQWLHHKAQQYLAGQQILQGLGILPATAASPLTFETLAGEQFTLQVAAGTSSPLEVAPDPTAGPIPDYLQQTGLNYWFSYSPANRMLYFKYNVCEDDPSNPFAGFSAAVLSVLDSQPVDTFVFDFRGNSGGDDSVIVPLLNGFAQRITTLLENPRFHIYDVIDQGTFSSGMDNAMTIKSTALQDTALFPGLNLDQVFTVIGQATGGEPNEFGAVQIFTLPGSGLTGQYSTAYFAAPPGIPNLPSFMPDIPISTRSTDYFARYDPVFGAMLARGGGAPPSPSGNVIAVNSASFRVDQGIAPGGIATAFGSFSAMPDQVQVNGTAGQLLGATASQAVFVIPQSVQPGAAAISVFAGGVGTGEWASDDLRRGAGAVCTQRYGSVAARRCGESRLFGEQQRGSGSAGRDHTDLRDRVRTCGRHTPGVLRGHPGPGLLQRSANTISRRMAC